MSQVQVHFDPDLVLNGVHKGLYSAFGKAGRTMRREAQHLIRRSRDRTVHSAPGEPPMSHGSGRNDWRNAFRANWDRTGMTAGPLKLSKGFTELNALHEFGGPHTVMGWDYSRSKEGATGGKLTAAVRVKRPGSGTRKRKAAYRKHIAAELNRSKYTHVVVYPARPTMSTAWDNRRTEVLGFFESLLN